MKKFDEINVIPLIDVMLVLLAIVLITASFITKDSLEIDLPDTDNTSEYIPPKEKPVNLAINAQGSLFIDEKPIAFSNLTQIIINQKYHEKTFVIVKVDDKTEFGYFIKLVDILRVHKLNNITFLTEKSK
jgi:biopolymer transport protein ExbD